MRGTTTDENEVSLDTEGDGRAEWDRGIEGLGVCLSVCCSRAQPTNCQSLGLAFTHLSTPRG